MLKQLTQQIRRARAAAVQAERSAPGLERRPSFEALESRNLLTLIGVDAILQLPFAQYDVSGATRYDAAADRLEVDAIPFAFIDLLGVAAGIENSPTNGLAAMNIRLNVDETGDATSVSLVDDFSLSGRIDGPAWGVDLDNDGDTDVDDIFDGVLLTGEVHPDQGFGFLDSASDPTVQYDFRFVVTGGLLQPLFFGKDIGVVLFSTEQPGGLPQFTGSFASDFGGSADGFLGAIPAQPSNALPISGRVYHDTENDGADTGNVGIEAVEIELIDEATNTVIATTFTNSTGDFFFADVPTGSYTLRQKAQPAGFLDGKETAGSSGGAVDNTQDSNTITGVSTGSIFNNFGEILPSSVGGTVFLDADASGLFDGLDTGIESVFVTLSGTNDRGEAVNTMLSTLADGSYDFTGLRPGTYSLTETQPIAFLDGNDVTGSAGGLAGNDVISAILLGQGVTAVGYNFGELPTPVTGTISGFKFRDVTGNGNSADDTGLEGTTVYIDANDNATLDSGELSAVTASDGSYSFTGLDAGSYIVREVVPTGWLRTGPTLVDHYDVVLASGATVTGIDFTNAPIHDCEISNVSFLINGSTLVTNLRGNTDQGDLVEVNFTVGGDHPITLTLVSYTAPESYFNANTASQQEIFDVVTGVFAPGVYTLALSVFVPNSNYQIDFVCGEAIDQLGPAGSNIFYSPQHRLISADNDGMVEVRADAATVAGSVYEDLDMSGSLTAGDEGIRLALVTLIGVTHSGQSITLTRYTKADGSYIFDNLEAGTYTITQTQPEYFADNAETVGSLGGDASVNDVISGIVVAAEQDGVGYNFGELTGATIDGLVWDDANGNGEVELDEYAIAGVTVLLTGVNDLGQSVNLSTVTDSDGLYEFAGLRAGTYQVQELQPAGYTDGVDLVGEVEGVVTGSLVANDVIGGITLGLGQKGVNYNFAEATIEGTLQSGMTATIGFWKNKNGQALLKQMNGSSCSTEMGNWLASNFQNIFGHTSGSLSTLNKTNSQVAEVFKKQFNVKDQKLNAQVMAVALAIYVTDSDLAGGTYAEAYGFTVDALGTGAATFNVGNAGVALGVENGSILTVREILDRTNDFAWQGILWDLNQNGKVNTGEEQDMRNLANELFTAINETGDIQG